MQQQAGARSGAVAKRWMGRFLGLATCLAEAPFPRWADDLQIIEAHFPGPHIHAARRAGAARLAGGVGGGSGLHGGHASRAASRQCWGGKGNACACNLQCTRQQEPGLTWGTWECR